MRVLATATALAAACSMSIAASASFPAPAIMSTDQIRPGMTGYWRTCVSGTNIVKYPMRVVGLVHNMIYPGAPVILCEALDEVNRHSGPVHGMSGSPVYINDKIVGAYAYGHDGQKDQALFMATPIELMIHASTGAARAARWPSTAGGADTLTKVMASGFSTATIEAFRDEFRGKGIELVAGAGGGVTSNLVVELEPGAPVAGVLAHGDFSMSAVGTVSYRDGDRIIAFGHPFMGTGKASMPMAGAEILAVSHQMQGSFKMANIGAINGAISFDSAVGIIATIGPPPPMIPVTIRATHPALGSRTYHASVICDRDLTPLAAASIVLDALGQGHNVIESKVARGTTTIVLTNGCTIVQTNTATESMGFFGSSPAAMTVARDMMQALAMLLTTTHGQAAIARIELDYTISEDKEAMDVRTAWLDRNVIQPGETLAATIEMQPYQKERWTTRVELPLPANIEPGTYTLHIIDGRRADDQDGVAASAPENLDQVVAALRKPRHPMDMLYVRLTSPSQGLVVGAAAMPSLPPTAVAQWRGQSGGTLSEVVCVETTVPCKVPVSANKQFTVTIR